ncbi:MAG: glycosyl hydrolase family 28 protein [Eubacteriales bacterium]|nr:glycosyl hydrolase family 28 protein [Eubacteriales bacterium]
MKEAVISIKEFGACGDGRNDDTGAVQKAIDTASSCGKTLVINEGVYRIETLFLRDNVSIVFEDGAVFDASTDISAYSDGEAGFVDAVGVKRGKALIIFDKVSNVKIKGPGLIRGNGDKLKSSERPFLLRIFGSHNITISDFRVESSPSWCIHICQCSDVTVENVVIYNRGCANNDGIDVDSSQNVRIIGCDISSGDDAICLKTTSTHPCRNITVKNCRVSSDWGAFKIGTESVGDFENVTVDHCCFHDVLGGGIKIVPTDGGSVENVNISDILMENCTGPIFVANGERNREYATEKSNKRSSIKNVKLNNITADVVRAPERGFYDGEIWGNSIGGIVISGTEANTIKDLKITNSSFALPGGYLGKIPSFVREMKDLYPEFHRFDPLPAKGIYIRHADSVSLENLSFSFKENDVRNMIITEDATDVKSNNVCIVNN